MWLILKWTGGIIWLDFLKIIYILVREKKKTVSGEKERASLSCKYLLKAVEFSKIIHIEFQNLKPLSKSATKD